MTQCWKCSSALTDKPRCESCNALNSLGDLSVHGVVRDDDEVTIYAVEDSPGHLIIDLHQKKGLLSQLPRPNKPNAMTSKAFKNIWKRAKGDHPLLQDATPQRYEALGEKGDRLLFIEVHGLSAQPSPAKTTNGVPQGAEAAIAEAEAAPVDEPPTQDIEEAAPEEATDAPEEAVAEEAAPEEAAPEETAAEEATPEASSPEPEEVVPLAAADAEETPADEGPLPGLDLAVLPEGNIIDPNERLATLREEIGLLLQGDEADEAYERLRARFTLPDSTRKLAENLYMHLSFGKLAEGKGDRETARTSLARAFQLDPRDKDVLQAYAHVLDRDTEASLSLQVDRNLLLHHRRNLDATALSGVYKRIGQAHRVQGDTQRARTSFEQALDARSDDQEALDLLLETLVDEGDAEQVIKVRTRLLDQMRDPKTRAILRIRIGDDHNALGDTDRAMEQYELAAAEHPNSTSLKRLAKLASDLGEWKRAAEAYIKMEGILRTAEDKSQAFLGAANIYHHQLGAWEQAATFYEKALETTPGQLDILTELVSLLASGEQWQELRGVYERMIERASLMEQPPRELLGVLWKKLGELLRIHLQELDEARAAYETASEISPEDLSLHELLADLHDGRDDAESQARAIHHNRQILALDKSTRFDAIERLGMAHLHLGEIDQALCVFRVLSYAGRANDQINAFLEKNSTQMLKPLSQSFDDDFFNKHLLSGGYDPMLGEVFSIVRDSLNRLLDHDPEHYSLTNKERVDRKDGLMFTKIYRDICAKLGHEKPPVVFHKKGLQGMFNASLHPMGFIVGDDILSGCSEKEVSFVVAKQLALFRRESFLLQTRTLKDMGIFFHIVLKVLNPNHGITLNKDTEKLAASIRKIKGEQLGRLGEVLGALAQKGQINLGGHQQAFEDAANRCGLLFCDDLSVCRNMISREPRPVNKDRSVDARMEPLIRWTLTPGYQVLRKDLGIALG